MMVTELSGVQLGLKTFVWFEITSMISDQNCTTRGSITTLLHPFWNCPNTGLGQFKYFIDAVLSRFEIKFIHFWEGTNWSFGNKSCKKNLPHDTLYLSFSCNLIGYFKQGLKFDWLFYFYCCLLVGWGKMQFKAKNGAIHEWITPIRANQITGTTNDFKMGVIKRL